MKDLKTFFWNPFDDEKISDEKISSFGIDHVNRLIDNNPEGKYNAMISVIQATYGTFLEDYVGTSDSTALRKAKTSIVTALLTHIMSQISQQEGTIRGKWGKGSDTYLEFYPSGITEYREATRDGIIPLLDRFIIAIGRHTAELGEPFLDTFRQLRTDYNSARSTQQQKKGDVSNDRLEQASSRKALNTQLFKNLLQIALDNIEKPEILSSYFDQSIIRTHISKGNGNGGEEPEEIEPVTGEVEPQTMKEMMHGAYTATTVFTLRNIGLVRLECFTASKPEGSVPATTVSLEPDEEKEVEASELGAVGNLYLMVYNPSKDQKGSYSCEAYNM